MSDAPAHDTATTPALVMGCAALCVVTAVVASLLVASAQRVWVYEPSTARAVAAAKQSPDTAARERRTAAVSLSE